MGFIIAFSGLAFHMLLLLSIFDIYFRSTIVKDVEPFQALHCAPARRVILFLIDGMRAETFLEHERTPFLRSVAATKGLWGKANTRAPTESRPGVVAILAGIYEDPSAVTKGWKKYPSDFDSVFNESRYTWSLGSENIVNLFTKGIDDEKHIFTFYYRDCKENLSPLANSTVLDDWVFRRAKKLFEDAKNDKELTRKLREDRIVFFIYLAGVDLCGHLYSPNNVKCDATIQNVDDIIRQLVERIEDFYDYDDQTTYIMTSDHGMTDWGSHGSSSKHETEVSYVIWGAGVAQGIPSGTGEGLVYGLPASRRKDIAQADFAPLMSTIISVPVPVNSIGKLPTDLLNMTLENKAKAIYSNGRQLAAQYNTLRGQMEANIIPLLHYPFRSFTAIKYKDFIDYADSLLRDRQYDKLISASEKIMTLSLSGLDYYHNYYQNTLLAFTSLSFCGWIALLLTLLLEQRESLSMELKNDNPKIKIQHENCVKLNVLFAPVSIVLTLVIFAQRLPFQYFLYSLLPVFLWWRVFSSADVWTAMFREYKLQASRILNLFTQTTAYALGTVALVRSFSERWWLCGPLTCMALWPFVSKRNQLSWTLLACWLVSCVLLGVFSFLPVVNKHTQARIPLVILAGAIWVSVSACYFIKILIRLHRSGKESRKDIKVLLLQMITLNVALWNIYIQHKRYTDATPVIFAHQLIAWMLVGISMIAPMFSSTRQVVRLFAINSGLVAFYLLLSVSHEGLFLVVLVLNQACWLLIEHNLSEYTDVQLKDYVFASNDNEKQEQRSFRRFTEHDFRRAFFFLVYIILSFFGTGNVASMNSFRVRWVTCFITKYRPFVITSLIMSKIMLPFLSVACTFRAVSIVTKAPTGYLIVMVLIFSDMMGLQFLFYVKNTGSWLEIGTSMSHYVIAHVITLLIILLYCVAKVLCSTDLYQLWRWEDSTSNVKSTVVKSSISSPDVSSKQSLTLPETMGYTMVQFGAFSSK